MLITYLIIGAFQDLNKKYNIVRFVMTSNTYTFTQIKHKYARTYIYGNEVTIQCGLSFIFYRSLWGLLL